MAALVPSMDSTEYKQARNARNAVLMQLAMPVQIRTWMKEVPIGQACDFSYLASRNQDTGEIQNITMGIG